MNKPKPDAPSPQKENGEGDPERIEQAQAILQLFGHTVSAMKLFPSDHSTVKKFFVELWEKLNDFLNENWKLELGIEETAFLFDEKVVYQKIDSLRSLPFLFFKDGMQMLLFYKGLNKEEFWGFLEAIRNDSLLPPEESDMVLSLWKKDFPNIQFFAPDDFLESRIGAGKGPILPAVDKSSLRAGRIELTVEDKASLEKSGREDDSGIEGPEKGRPETGQVRETEDDAIEAGALDEMELAEIEALIRSNREISTDEDFINVLLEILHLEERLGPFISTLGILGKRHQSLVQNGDIAMDYLLLTQIRYLRESYAPDNERAYQLEKFLKYSCDEKTMQGLKSAVLKGQISDYAHFFEYLRLFGWTPVPTVADLYEEKDDGPFRDMAAAYFEEFGSDRLHALTVLARDSKPLLAKRIISILGRADDNKGLPYLAAFKSSKNAAIRAGAIATLGNFSDVAANKNLIGFLGDEVARNRVAAASNLHFFGNGDRPTMESLLEIIGRKDFSEKSPEEKSAILDFLAQSPAPEDLKSLTRSLRRRGLFLKADLLETRLCAVAALAKANTPLAKEVLESFAKAGPKPVRQAASAALRNLPTRPPLRNA